MIGGSRGRGAALKDVWALENGEPPTWTALAPRDTLSEGGENASAIYDDSHDEVLLYGGDETTVPRRWEYLKFRHGAFALSLADPTWRSLEIVGGPAGNRTNQATVLDPHSGDIVSFGGLDDQIGGSCDTWAIRYDGTHFAYEAVDSCDGPPGFSSPTAVVDPSGQRMILYGGDERVWTRRLNGGGGWTAVDLEGSVPRYRTEHAAVFDTRRRRMLVWGGGYGVAFTDLWQFTLGGSAEGPERPVPRIPPPEPDVVGQNPARGWIEVALTLAPAEESRIEVFDLAGRRVAAREVRGLGGGRQVVRLDETAELRSGVYLLRVTRGGRVQSSRVVLLR